MNKLYKNKQLLSQKYIDEKLSSYKISKLANCTRQAILYWLEKFNIPIRARDEHHKGKFMEEGFNWKGGRYLDSMGYINIYKPDHPRTHSRGYVHEHRLVMEEAVGRYLNLGECVHHVDGNR